MQQEKTQDSTDKPPVRISSVSGRSSRRLLHGRDGQEEVQQEAEIEEVDDELVALQSIYCAC